MQTVFGIALSNALVVAVLGLVVYGISRVCKRPALIHCLWLVVLVKLVTPPLISVPIQLSTPEIPVDVGVSVTMKTPEVVIANDPLLVESDPLDQMHVRPQRPGEIVIASELDTSDDETPPAGNAVPTPSPNRAPIVRLSVAKLLAAIWIAGACACLARSLSRVVRFRRLLRYVEPAGVNILERVNVLARGMGITRIPQTYILPGTISPMLWTFSPRACLLLPGELIDDLSDDAIETLLVHELAHYRRRDHWVRGLELIVTSLFWWHPVVWLAVRKLRDVEEECCDGWVVGQLPELRATYARTLVQTVKFLSARPSRMPAVAGALGQGLYRSVEQRVRSIMSTSPTRGVIMSRSMQFALILFALAVLPLLPLIGDESDGKNGQAAEATGDSKQSTDNEGRDGNKLPETQSANPKAAEPTSFAGSAGALGNVADLAVSPDGRIIVAGHGLAGGPGALSVWDLEKSRPIGSFPEKRQAMGISFSKDGKLVAYGTWDNLVRIRRTDTFEVVQELRGFQFSPVHTAFSPDGKQLALAQQEVVLYDTNTWAKHPLKIEKDSFIAKASFGFNGVEFSPDGSRLLAVGVNRDRSDFFGRAVVWDSETGKIVTAVPYEKRMVCAAFAPDGKRFVTGDNRMLVCDTETGEIKQVCTFPRSGVYEVAWSPGGKQILAAGSVRGYGIFNPETGELTQLFDRPKDPKIRFNTCRFTPDGSKIVTGNSEKKIKVWDAKSHELLAEFPSNTETNTSDQPVLAIACSVDGRWIAAGREDATITIHSADNGDVVKVLEGHEDVVPAVAFASTGMLASASYDEAIKLWDVKSGAEIRTLEGHDNWVFGVAFSPDGKRLASCGYDKTIRLWNSATGEQTALIKGHTAAVRAIAFSPDGKQLATASSDRSVRVWDVAAKKEVAVLKGHRGTVRTVAFSADGKLLASGSEDNTTRLWSTSDWKEQRALAGHEGMVWSVAFSAGGQNIATASFDRTVKVWDPRTGQVRQTLRGHSDVVSSVAFAPDTSAIVSGGLDRSIRIWRAAGSRTTAAKGPQIHIFNPDNSELKRLVTGTDFDHHGSPNWSPDGKLIAYDAWKGSAGQNFRQSHVFVVRPDGTGLKELGDGAIPRISPDGKRIAFCRYNPVGVWVMNADGSDRQIVEPDAWSPTWSPDGKEVAYTVYAGDAGNVRIVNLKSKEERLLLEGNHAKRYEGVYWGMRWSPDGKRFCLKGVREGGEQEVAVVHASGSSKGFETIYTGATQFQFTWRPDSKRFAVAINNPRQGGFRLFEFDPDSKAAPILLPNQPTHTANRSCDWAPDGKRLAITCELGK